jgi:hypothetical protein
VKSLAMSLHLPLLQGRLWAASGVPHSLATPDASSCLWRTFSCWQADHAGEMRQGQMAQKMLTGRRETAFRHFYTHKKQL